MFSGLNFHKQLTGYMCQQQEYNYSSLWFGKNKKALIYGNFVNL